MFAHALSPADRPYPMDYHPAVSSSLHARVFPENAWYHWLHRVFQHPGVLPAVSAHLNADTWTSSEREGPAPLSRLATGTIHVIPVVIFLTPLASNPERLKDRSLIRVGRPDWQGGRNPPYQAVPNAALTPACSLPHPPWALRAGVTPPFLPRAPLSGRADYT